MSKKAGKELGENDGFSVTVQGDVILSNDNDDSRRVIESCYKRHRTTINPIIDWEDADVWNFIHAEKIPYCELYNEGFHRLGCIGCPMATQRGREKEFARWPKYKANYLRAFEKMLDLRKERHEKDPSRPVWRVGGKEYVNPTAQDVFNWWMEYDIIPGQESMEDQIKALLEQEAQE